MTELKWNNRIKEPALVAILNFILMMVVFSLCRLFFFWVNKEYFPDVTSAHLFNLMRGGIQFDLAALLYVNVLYVFLQIIPFRFRLNAVYQKVLKWIYLITNSIVIIMNCADIPFFRFTNRRTTSTIFGEFENEGNLFAIITRSLFEYWYVTLFALLLIFLLYKLYQTPAPQQKHSYLNWKRQTAYYLVHTGIMVLIAYFIVIGIRGGFGKYTRPITLSNANQYVNKSNETAIVLNTPFSIIRTINKEVYKNPNYFSSDAEMEQVFSPVHNTKPAEAFKPLNVVVLILESFGKEYTGFFNKDLDNGTYKGYTPFLDSLLAEGLTFDYSYGNGRKSIDGMPSVLSSIPMFIEPFVLTPYAVNEITGVASLLKDKGYYTAFFHGAPNNSMGFQAYAKSAGFDNYLGMNEYPDNNAFDGTWAIWDEEFLQFYADEMGKMPQPFVTSVFTASSHHPFKIPEKYDGKFPEGNLPIHKCVGYSDYALKRFFEKMSQYDWFSNTLFVITADHTNQSDHDIYKTDVGVYSVPILFYQPGSELKGRLSLPVQQIDILPSIMSYLNYDKPYIAFGQDVFSTNVEDKYVVNYNNQFYQLFDDNYFLQFDGEQTKAIYAYKEDVMLTNNLLNSFPEEKRKEMETHLKAMIQQYIVRTSTDNLKIK